MRLFARPLIAILLLGVSLHDSLAQPSPKTKVGGSVFVKAPLSNLEVDTAALRGGQEEAAARALTTILKEQLGATGQESFRPARTSNKVFEDRKGRKHFRFEQSYQGIPVVDTAMVMHVDADGKVFAVNGEFVADGSVDMKEQVTCEEAFQGVLDESKYEGTGEWLTECAIKIVMDRNGRAHKAWERMVGYQPEGRPYLKDFLYASVVTGHIVAVRPQIKESLKMKTLDCSEVWWDTYGCQLVTRSSDELHTGDKAIDLAHNYARATYKFFFENFGRDSIDDNGMRIVSHVHVGQNYSNAYWDGASVNYGDGGTTFLAFSLDADVVAHEITHGVTQYSSNLVYYEESGAINEAMSDIFGACVDYQEGASKKHTWLVGEDIFTPGIPGDGLRYMNNPTLTGSFDADYYPERYIGWDDNGGVHWNSGIANLAFVLMVQGGKHPRAKTDITVPRIADNFRTSLMIAAEIFYKANTGCLTPGSGFFEARECTEMFADDFAADYTESVSKAWDAVGCSWLPLDTSNPMSGLSADEGQALQFRLDNVPAGHMISCRSEGENGDADLYINMVNKRDYWDGRYCESTGFSSIETCSVGPIEDPSRIFVTVKAFEAFTDLTLTCTDQYTWTDLQDGVELVDQKIKRGTGKIYRMAGIPPLTAIKCDFVASDGKPSLYDSLEDVNGVWIDSCSLGSGSFIDDQATCAVNGARQLGDFLLHVDAYDEDVRDLDLICSLVPMTINSLKNWVTFEDSNIHFLGQTGTIIRYYPIEPFIRRNRAITCVVAGANYAETDLLIHFGDIFDASEDSVIGCSSYGYGSSDVECTTGPAVERTKAFAQVVFYRWDWDIVDPAYDIKIICGEEPNIQLLQNGTIYANLLGEVGGLTALHEFRLNKVLKGETLTCSISSNQGNADLYVATGMVAHPLSIWNQCQAVGPGSKGKCTTPILGYDSPVYATIHAVSDYTKLTLKCVRDSSTCTARRQSCNGRYECCGSLFTCDGPSAKKRICKKVVAAGGACVRHSQCEMYLSCIENICQYV